MNAKMEFKFISLILLGATLIILNSCKKGELKPSTIKDIDGNIYQTMVIGNQEWMAENLKATTYNNGTPIPNITNNTEWTELNTDAYAWYNNDEATYKDTYGALYNWYAVETGNLCPTGWRVPSDTEWTILTDYAGGDNVAGGKLKSTRTEPDSHPRWFSPNTGATDEYGFSALPGGSHADGDGAFRGIGGYGCWWSSTQNGVWYAWVRLMGCNDGLVYRNDISGKGNGYSVRCIRDN